MEAEELKTDLKELIAEYKRLKVIELRARYFKDSCEIKSAMYRIRKAAINIIKELRSK